MNIKDFFNNNLPLNRKERFYTGTVLPMIVAKDNFIHFHLFFSLINKTKKTSISATTSSTNIQFFTEYSFIESLSENEKKNYKDLPNTKDTPDVIILIENSEKILIAIEAKMFDSPNADELNKQMRAQANILESIKKNLNIDNIYHFALLPNELTLKIKSEFSFPVITWEEILSTYKNICSEDYFFHVLNLAIEKYSNLKSKEISFGKNKEKEMKGQYIYNSFKDKTIDQFWMGRQDGLNGPLIFDDILKGRWQRQKYQTSSKLVNNKNWFSIKDFVEMIDKF